MIVHEILGEIDGKIGDILLSSQTGFGFGEHGVAPAVGGVAAEPETAAIYGW